MIDDSAGVSGLTCALLLAKQKGNAVTVVAKHMPGDYDIEYTSPWAGANVLPYVNQTAPFLLPCHPDPLLLTSDAIE